MANKYYVVWSGRRTGIFTEWTEAQPLVDKFPGARYKSFATREEAEQAYRSGKPVPTGSIGNARTKQPKVATDAVEPGARIADVRIYCDGACDPNPGKAGSGLAVYRQGELKELWYGLYNPHGTNNTAELNALHHALLMAETAIAGGETVDILCDSTYAIKCISVWAAGWEKKGWRKATGEIRNLEIIQAAYALYSRIQDDVRLSHVSAHVGTEGNELADRMAMYAVLSKQVELRRYDRELDIAAILRMRAG
jgi:ribonuclease HI